MAEEYIQGGKEMTETNWASANAILKHATRHYTVMIKPKATG